MTKDSRAPEPLTRDQLRKAFLDFFAGKGHTVIPSSSLIPWGDPTLLFTTAGMVQIKPYFTGEAVPPSPRLASCQKCFRTTDIESVGDPTHLTFFEMLGNFSVGDYFKPEAIAWGWEFVTEVLKLPAERLRVTVFQDDDEAEALWRQIGVPRDKISRLGEKDNFWGPAGDSGPCGPCSEIHYDFGPETGCGRPDCDPGCGCGRFSEIWNLVFTQFDQAADGMRTTLPKPNIDTGMGLERVAAILQGKASVYETDFYAPYLKWLQAVSGKTYGQNEAVDLALRVIAEHGRGISFLIADGVLPGNEGAGYVLRRLIRRSLLFARRLGLEQPFLSQVADVAAADMAGTYPELKSRGEFIRKVIQAEEARFYETLSVGLELIERIISREVKTRQISGQDAFELYDTYGFPLEMTRDIAADSGFTVDEAGFEAAMEEQRGRARAAHSFANATREAVLESDIGVSETPFVGDSDLDYETSLLTILRDGKSIGDLAHGEAGSLVLEATPFYAEMGGQVADIGRIQSAEGAFEVTHTYRIPPAIVVHEGKVTAGRLDAGTSVRASVDRGRRADIARNHTGTHILQYALRQVVGTHVQQRGSLVSEERLRFDFSHLEALTRDEIEQIELLVNESIRDNLPVTTEEVPYQKAIEAGALAFFGDKYGETVRVIRVGEPPVSVELCGGTHVSSTGEIGFCHIVSEGSIGAGIRRIEAVTGRGAESFARRQALNLEEIAGILKVSPDEARNKVESILAEADAQRRQIAKLERQLSSGGLDDLVKQAETVNGVTLLAVRVPDARIETLRETADMIRDKLPSAVVVLGSVYQDKPVFLAAVSDDLVARGYDAGKIVRAVAQATGGGGGGKPRLAQAGGRDASKLDAALAVVRDIVAGGN